jgi:hypothetical protein
MWGGTNKPTDFIMTYVLSICITAIFVSMLTLIFYLAYKVDEERERVRELTNLIEQRSKL